MSSLLPTQTGMLPRGRLPEIFPEPPQPAGDFVNNLRANDAAFKVIEGQGRILSTKVDIVDGQKQPLIAVGDPSVIEFTVVSTRQLRITGLRLGTTDLSITTANGETLSFEVVVEADLSPLTARLQASFPEASIRLSQLKQDIVVEGQARDAAQVTNIIEMIYGYQVATAASRERQVRGGALKTPSNVIPNGGQPLGEMAQPTAPDAANAAAGAAAGLGGGANPFVSSGEAVPLDISGKFTAGQVINLLRLPGSQQVLLKVRVAELNRTALRRIGANFLGVDPSTGAIFGSQVANPVTAAGLVGKVQSGQFTAGRAFGGAALAPTSANTTAFGIFQDAGFEFTLNALRQNAMLKILAEPNLVALHGHEASFLAGGEFPVPVPQVSAGGVAATITVQFKEFGVRLNFLPFILDGDVVRLRVAPEVSQVDFTIATTLVAGGTPVPGLNTRKAETTVELREGQTLAIAGLLQLALDGKTDRIPGVGDLPIIGPFFSNTSSSRVEKELVVLVTPYLIEPMNQDQVGSTPGDEVKGPNDLELFFLNRIEGRTGKDFRATTRWDDPFHLNTVLKLEQKYINGPSGFSD